MRRSRLLIFLTATATLLSGAFLFTGPGAGADTAKVEIAYEGWYDRFRDEDVQADPGEACTVVTAIPGQGCGAVSPGDNPSPRSESTGVYVVAANAGEVGDRIETQADSAWAAFQWDMLDYQEATVEKFVVHLTLAEHYNNRNRGDTYTGPEALPPIQACNVLEGWGSDPGANAWPARPPVSGQCVPATKADGTPVGATESAGRTIRFDVTSFAQTWVEGKGFGFVVRPGTPTTKTLDRPFQITFSGYYDVPTDSSGCGAPATVPNTTTQCTTTSPTAPSVEFAYTPPVEEDFGSFDDVFDDSGLFEDVTTSGESGILEAVPDIDVIPTDEGSEPLPEDIAAEATGTTELASPTTRRPARPISTDTSFPWAVLLLLPVIAVAFWSTGTALGPIGDPVPARTGGVSRVLAERQAAHRGSDLKTRNR